MVDSIVVGGTVGVVVGSRVVVETVVLTTGGTGTGSGNGCTGTVEAGTGVDDADTVSDDVIVTGISDEEGGGSLNVSRMVIVC